MHAISGGTVGLLRAVRWVASVGVVLGALTALAPAASASCVGSCARSFAQPLAVLAEAGRPVLLARPSVVGSTIVGEALAVTPGTWSESPTVFAYQWQLCNATGNECRSVVGATTAAYTLTLADLGHTLRAKVTAENAAGSTSTVSPISRVIGSRIEATVTWEFFRTRTYVLVEELTAHGLIKGESVQLSCHGGGCPFSTWRHTASHSNMSLASVFRRRHLHGGAHISVEIVKASWVGKYYLFIIRTNARAGERQACLPPESKTPAAVC